MKKWRFDRPHKGSPTDLWIEVALVDESGRKLKQKGIHIDDVKEWLGLKDEPTKIKDIPLGQKGYIVPWAIDPNEGTLDPEYPVDEERGGTATVLVTHVKHGYFTIELKLGD